MKMSEMLQQKSICDSKKNANLMEHDKKYLPQLMAEKDSIHPSFVHASRLINCEIDQLKNSEEEKALKLHDQNEFDQMKLVDLGRGKMTRVECRIKIPVDEYPGVNLVGKIIGTGGSTIQHISRLTQTTILVEGKGSLRDSKRAEELCARGDEKWAHLRLPLHVKICSTAAVHDAYMRVGQACSEIIQLIESEDENIENSPRSSQHVSYGNSRWSSSQGFQRKREFYYREQYESNPQGYMPPGPDRCGLPPRIPWCPY